MRKIRKFHIAIGIFSAAPLIWIALTGMILSFHDRKVSSSQFPVHTLPLESWIQAAVGNDTLSSIEFPRDSELPIRLRLLDSTGKSKGSVWINSQNGTIEAPPLYADLIEWVYRLHRGSFAGKPGRGVATFIGVLVPVLWIGGLAIRRGTAHRKAKVLKSIQYHRSLGLWMGGILTVVTLSGAVLNFYTEIVGAVDPLPSLSAPTLAKERPSLTQKIAQAWRVRPKAQLLGVYFRKGSPDLDLYYFSDNSRVYLSRYSHSVVKIMDPQTQWIHNLLPFHGGRLFGQVGQAVMFLIGLGAVVTIGFGLQASLKLDVSRWRR